MEWREIIEQIKNNVHLLSFTDYGRQDIIEQLDKVLNNCSNTFIKQLNVESTTFKYDDTNKAYEIDLNISYIKMDNGLLSNPRKVNINNNNYLIFHYSGTNSLISFDMNDSMSVHSTFGNIGTQFIYKPQQNMKFEIVPHPTDPEVFFVISIGNSYFIYNYPEIQIIMFRSFMPVIAYYVSKQDLFNTIINHQNFGGFIPGRTQQYAYTGCLSIDVDETTGDIYILVENDYCFDRYYELIKLDTEFLITNLYNGNTSFLPEDFIDVINLDIYKISYGNSDLDKHIGFSMYKRMCVYNGKMIIQHYYYKTLVEFNLTTGSISKIYESPKVLDLSSNPIYNIHNIGSFTIVSQDTTKAIELWNGDKSFGWFSVFEPIRNTQMAPLKIGSYNDIFAFYDTNAGDLMFVLCDRVNNAVHIGSMSDITSNNNIIFEPVTFTNPVYIERVVIQHSLVGYKLYYRKSNTSNWIEMNNDGVINEYTDWVQIKIEIGELADKTLKLPDDDSIRFYNAYLMYRID